MKRTSGVQTGELADIKGLAAYLAQIAKPAYVHAGFATRRQREALLCIEEALREFVVAARRHPAAFWPLVFWPRFEAALAARMAQVNDYRAAFETPLPALEGLPVQQREVLFLRTWQGLSISEASGALGVSEQEAKRLLFRALTALRADGTKTTEEMNDHDTGPLVLALRDRLDRIVRELDADTCAALEQICARVLEIKPAPQFQRGKEWKRVVAIALMAVEAIAVAIAIVWRMRHPAPAVAPASPPRPAATAIVPVSSLPPIVKADYALAAELDSLDFLDNLEFYSWYAEIADPRRRTASSVVALAAPAPSWKALSSAQRESFSMWATQWDRLPEAERRQLVENAEHWNRLSAKERAQLAMRLEAIESLPPVRRAGVRARYQAWRQHTSGQRVSVWQAYTNFQVLPPEDQQKWRQRFAELPMERQRDYLLAPEARDLAEFARATFAFVAPGEEEATLTMLRDFSGEQRKRLRLLLAHMPPGQRENLRRSLLEKTPQARAEWLRAPGP